MQSDSSDGKELKGYWELSRRILSCAFRGQPVREFLGDIGRLLLDFSGCDEIEIRLRSQFKEFRVVVPGRPEGQPGESIDDLERTCRAMLDQRLDIPLDTTTKRGAILIRDNQEPGHHFNRTGPHRSLLFIPLFAGGEEEGSAGVVVFKSAQPHYFRPSNIELLEEVTAHLTLAITDRRSHASLRERVKELTCLYQIALLIEQPEASQEEIFQGIVEVLPPAWLYPEDAWARLTVDQASYTTGNAPEQGRSMEAEITAGGKRRGTLELGYTVEKPFLDEGPFLKEERNLLDTVAREVSRIIERRDMEEARRKLQQQLMHAERLATIGEMFAGIAHELNDPLNNVLGYAQLAQKCDGLPDQAGRDLEKVVVSALHARQVIQQVLLFARRMPQRRTDLDMSELVEQAYSFLEALCMKANVEVIRMLATDLPPVSADPDQMRQVLVNLVVNAIQAMPSGGRLTLTTESDPENRIIRLIVKDTGTGMPEEVSQKAFVPFFTTREEGTGLGLAVVEGIVSSHGGSVQIESQVGKGSRFEVRLAMKEKPAGGIGRRRQK